MTAPRKEDRWMSVPAAARRLGVTPPTAKMWAYEGRLRYAAVAGRMVIERASVDAYIKTHGKIVANAGVA